jgi:hypothetical protein
VTTLVRAMAGEFVGPFATPETGSGGALGQYVRVDRNCGGPAVPRSLDVTTPEPMTVAYRFCETHGVEEPDR